MNTRANARALGLPLLAALWLAAAPASADEPVLREGDPGFRTEVGLHLSFGGHSCVGGGSEYGACFGQGDYSWDTSWGLFGGVQARPFNRFSFGLDVGYTNLIHHQNTDETWSDLLLGPVARYHHPLRLANLYFEPNLGVQLGYVRGIYHQKKLGSTTVDFENEHLGLFLGIMLGADWFLLPRVAVGIEFRLIRTFYLETCKEWSGGVNCRATDDKDLASRGDPNREYANEPGVATFPWKLFYGIHGLYYF